MSDVGSGEIRILDRLYALLTAGQWVTAEQVARSAVATYPDYYYPLWGLSRALLNLDRVEEARDAAEAASALAPDVFWNAMQLSDVALRQGDQPRALEAAGRAVDLAPTSPYPHRRVAWACGTRSVKSDPGSVVDPHGALAAIARAMQLDPGVSHDHRFRAGILTSLGRRSEAESEYRTALELEPNSHESVNNLALLHLPRRPIRAASLFRTSARLDPSCPNPRRNLTSAVHAALFWFTWVLLGVGVASFVLRALVGAPRELGLLAATLLAGTVGAGMLWRELPRGARADICRHRWPVGLVFAGVALAALAGDVGVIVSGPRARVCCVGLLIAAPAVFLLIRRSRWAPRIGRRFGQWLLPGPQTRSKDRHQSVDLVSRQ